MPARKPHWASRLTAETGLPHCAAETVLVRRVWVPSRILRVKAKQSGGSMKKIAWCTLLISASSAAWACGGQSSSDTTGSEVTDEGGESSGSSSVVGSSG